MKFYKILIEIDKNINHLENMGDYKIANLLHKQFIKIAQETAPVSSNDTNSNATTTPTATPNTGTNQIEVITDGSSSNSSSENKSTEPEKIEIRAETYGLLANSIASISIRQNMSMSEALDKIVSLGTYFNGKPLGTHVNFDKLKKQCLVCLKLQRKLLVLHTNKEDLFVYML